MHRSGLDMCVDVVIIHIKLKAFVLFAYPIHFSGGSEQRLVDAATKQLKTLPFYHSFWNRTNQPALVRFKTMSHDK